MAHPRQVAQRGGRGTIRWVGLALLLVLFALEVPSPMEAGAGRPMRPTVPEAMDEARRWVAARLLGLPDVRPPQPGLTVLANHDPVQRNARGGRPLNIAGRQYRRGLYCHAVSRVVVRLPGPGARFNAVVGVDSNEQTSGGRGSIIFSVHGQDRELFRSPVMREGMPGLPVSAALDGARELSLEVGDAGDGISCDQADWAEARVVLADGRVVWLGDLPIAAPRPPYTTELPFSFRYGARHSRELLASWERSCVTRALDDCRTEHVLTWTEPGPGLMLRLTAIQYQDFPTVEWTLRFRNLSASDSPILEDILVLDTTVERPAEGEFVLHHHTGSPCTPTDYQPFQTTLGAGQSAHFAPPRGRPTDSVLPYFNVEWRGEGLIVVVAWPGQWAAHFARDGGSGLHVRAGQERTRFRLHPAEEVSAPGIVLQFWRGDRVDAQNVWRAWMVAHNLPRPGGRPVRPQMAACSSHQFGEMIHANEENQKLFVDRYVAERLPLDYWWMDAGWYVNQTGWPNTGTWEVDLKRFPGGLRAITDHAHARGIKSIVWFEPERVTPGTWLYDNHPEWLLGPHGQQKLLNLGHPEARRWLTEHVDSLLTSQGIDLYRQDFNMDPLDYWRANDAPDRQGITEIRHVEGYLAYWDELRRRHPDLLIDSCASGGRRNDLETLRRAVPLLRSDYILEPVSQQLHTYGIAFWIPLYGTGVNSTDPYVFRSQMCPHITGCYDVRRKDLRYGALRRLIGQWKRVADYYLGDYYPLTPYSTASDAWMAWQFHSPERGEGMVQAFRRSESPYEAARLKLRGLDAEAHYTVASVDSPSARTRASGRELMERGLLVTVEERPGAALIVYRPVRRP